MNRVRHPISMRVFVLQCCCVSVATDVYGIVHVQIVICTGVPSSLDVSLFDICCCASVSFWSCDWFHVSEWASRVFLVIPTVVQVSLLLLASWSNCPLETIERLCEKGLKEPALVGAFFEHCLR